MKQNVEKMAIIGECTLAKDTEDYILSALVEKKNFSIADSKLFASLMVSLFQDTKSSPYAMSCRD